MRFKKKNPLPTINPDEIFLDASNLPLFNTQQFEGQLEKPIQKRALRLLQGVFVIGLLIFVGKIFGLQIIQGQTFAERSRQNHYAPGDLDGALTIARVDNVPGRESRWPP